MVAPSWARWNSKDGPGTQSGNPGTSDTEGLGYFDVSGYHLDANKVASNVVRRGITVDSFHH